MLYTSFIIIFPKHKKFICFVCDRGKKAGKNTTTFLTITYAKTLLVNKISKKINLLNARCGVYTT